MGVSVDVTLIDKNRLKAGKEVERDGVMVTPKYLDLTLLVKKANPYGHSHAVVQKTSKAERDEGLVLPFLGSAVTWESPEDAAPRQPQAQPQAQPVTQMLADDDVPF